MSLSAREPCPFSGGMPPSRGKALVESLPKPPPSQRAARSSDPFEGAFFAPGAAGQQARQLVRKVCMLRQAAIPRAHPPLRGAQYRDQGVTLQLVQERSGNYKPLYRAFPRKDGLSTVPILMQGHPDDVKGGRLISSEVRHVLPHYHTHHSTRSDWWTGPGP